MQRFIKKLFVCISTLLVLTTFLDLQAGADPTSSTLGTQSPAITAAYYTDAELQNVADGNALTSGESYYMVLSVTDLASVSMMQFTASYDATALMFTSVELLPDIDTGFDAITPVAAAGKFVFGFVSTDSEFTALADDSAVLAVAQITVISEEDIDVAEVMTVNTNPNYTFIEVSYADISYDAAGKRVYNCYGLAEAEDFAGTVYTTMSVDLSPEVNFGYTVSAKVGYITTKTGSLGTQGKQQKLREVTATTTVNGETVSAVYDQSTGTFTFENIPDGTYAVTVSYPYGLDRTVTIIVDGADVISDTVIGLVTANFRNSDKNINANDLRDFTPKIGISRRTNQAAYEASYFMDVNGDNNINANDLKILSALIGISGRTYKYADLTIQNVAE